MKRLGHVLIRALRRAWGFILSFLHTLARLLLRFAMSLLITALVLAAVQPFVPHNRAMLYVAPLIIAIASWHFASRVLIFLRRALRTKVQTATKQLFLRLAFLDMVAIVTFVVLGTTYVRDIHGPPLVVSIVILALTLWMCVYAMRLAWRVDAAREYNTPKRYEKIRFDAKNLEVVFIPCQALAMLGALFGIFLIASAPSSADLAVASHNIDVALSNGLLATMTGIASFLLLYITSYLIDHEMERHKFKENHDA